MKNILTNDMKIEELIYEIRGIQVMLDSDLAILYHCKNGTKEINQAVYRHPEKFPERYCFILNDNDLSILRSQNVTANISSKARTKPKVFTEQGVAMLATILKSKVAIEASIKIIDAFVSIRKYFNTTLIEQKHINNMVLEHDNRIDLLEDSLDKLEEKKKNNDIYFAGQIYDAYSKILDIFNEAKKELIIIDYYADKNLLDIIKKIKVKVIIITKENSFLSKNDLDKYNKQYSNLKVIYSNTYHDRFFILDNNTVYHCGTSINSIGKKTFAINLFTNEYMIQTLLSNIQTLNVNKNNSK